jgi:hypothetical protein
MVNKLFMGVHFDNKKKLIDLLKNTKKIGGNILQIYMGNKRLTTLSEKIKFTKIEIKEIKDFLKKNNMKIVVHSILTLNFCKDPLEKRNEWGITNVIYDMNILKKLGGIGVVIHLRSYKTPTVDTTYENCVTNYIRSLQLILDRTKKINIILETPVNIKNVIGGTKENFIEIYKKIPENYQKRVKICIDTQHIFASGYNIRNLDSTKEYFEYFLKNIGTKNIALIHLNDSKKEFYSLVNRHESIGKGFIFSNQNETLKYILNFAEKYKINIILETNEETFKNELKYLHKILLSGGTKKKNIKNIILKIFREILLFHESLGEDGNEKTKYRIDSYRKAIKSIETFKNPIYSSNDIKDLPYIGKSFYEKIDMISEKGTINIYENIKKNNKLKSIKLFEQIWGIGTELSKKIIKKNIYTIDQLKVALKNKEITLTKQQLIGLKYYKDLNRKISHDEITIYTNNIKEIINNENITLYNAGSYRSNKKYSGDIDLIICYEKMELNNVKNIFYNKLVENNLIKEILVSGNEKCIYIIKLDDYKYYRKMDIAFVIKENLPWYLLYFGSGREFSKKIRIIASKLGYKLNEKGLFNKINGEKINFYPKEEKDIFKYLNIEYIHPEDRI